MESQKGKTASVNKYRHINMWKERRNLGIKSKEWKNR
jgi:hypothetical protein